MGAVAGGGPSRRWRRRAATLGDVTPRYASTMTLVSTSGPMCRLAFTHLVEIAFPLNLAEAVGHIEQALALQELAERTVDQRLFRRLAGQRHRLAHDVLVEDDVG